MISNNFSAPSLLNHHIRRHRCIQSAKGHSCKIVSKSTCLYGGRRGTIFTAMIIKPMIRNNICLNAHPQGCAHVVNSQIEYVRRQPSVSSKIRSVLVIGASAGYGLASRIVAAFGYGAQTIGVAFEKPSSGKRTATPGWYCNQAFSAAADAAGLRHTTIIGDAFSNEVREQVIDKIKREYGKIDLVIYSIASGLRTDPQSAITHRSVLKPIGKSYHAQALDPVKGTLFDVSIEPATEDEIAATVKVMGGEDWKLWSQALVDNSVLSDDALNIAYSYIGPHLTFPIYRDGTIGRAKVHLEQSAHDITNIMSAVNGRAFVSVNKAVVTRASAVIPVIPLYLAILFKVMKERGLHENVIEQMQRLFSERLYCGGDVPCDTEGRIRLDDWEMKEEVQNEVTRIWNMVTSENRHAVSDLEEYNKLFLNIHGFGFDDIDYTQDIAI